MNITKSGNGSSKMSITIIISLLVALLTFLGGRYSIVDGIRANETVNRLQDQEIKQMSEVMKSQGVKIDNIHEIVIRMDQKLSYK